MLSPVRSHPSIRHSGLKHTVQSWEQIFTLDSSEIGLFARHCMLDGNVSEISPIVQGSYSILAQTFGLDPIEHIHIFEVVS